MSNQLSELSFSPQTIKAVSIAQAIAKENMNATFCAPHLLQALLHKDAGLEPLLLKTDADVYFLKDWADVRIESLPKAPPKEIIAAGDNMEDLFNEADMVRILFNQNDIEPVHLMAAICTPGVAFSFDQLRTFPLKRDDLITLISRQNEQSVLFTDNQTQNTSAHKPAPSSFQAILKYCIDKTLLATEGKIDPIIGREQQTREIAEVFGRRLKPNVIIVGEPGVGKSALIDGFALAIAEKKVPAFLQNAKILELNSGALIAGASYKGEIEDRLKNILAEIKQLDKAIFFIDEIHSLLDKNGAVAGAANLLKPELARGEITLIGATTIDEYRKHIEPDEAFARRFEVIEVKEPDITSAYRMIKGIIPFYEKHHSIQVDDEVIKESIRLAKRYIKDRRLPDAAIDLTDRTMAALRLAIETGVDVLCSGKKAFEELKSSDKADSTEEFQWHFTQLKNNLNPIVWSELNLEDDVDKMTDVALLKQYIEGIYTKLETILPITRNNLSGHDIASIVADKTGIPIGKIQVQEKDRLLNMPEILKQRVVGQDRAISSISEAILESRAGLSKPGQPIGSFFFLGPTGTGKTELAKGLAEFLFQNENNIIRFDMSEFKEEHSAALLYGAPPGYVGYEEGGLLVNKIRQQPYSIVLFDEIEKAHHSVFDIFLQIMDEGKLHDKLGKEGDFSNSLILFTSNIGSRHIVDQINAGNIPTSVELLEIMSKHFRPEFLGRLTEIIPFSPMTQTMVENILSIQLKSLYKALEKEKIGLNISEKAKNKVAQLGFTPEYGARPLSTVIRNQIRRPLARKMISGELVAGSTIHLDLDETGELIWKNQ